MSRAVTGCPGSTLERFGLEKLLEAEFAALAADPRLFVATERCNWVEGASIDVDLTGPDPARNVLGVSLVGTPDTTRQPVDRVVRDGDRLILGVVGEDGKDRPKDF